MKKPILVGFQGSEALLIDNGISFDAHVITDDQIVPNIAYAVLEEEIKRGVIYVIDEFFEDCQAPAKTGCTCLITSLLSQGCLCGAIVRYSNV